MSVGISLADVLRQGKSYSQNLPLLNKEICERLSTFENIFNVADGGEIDDGINIFTFHVPVPDTHRVIDYVDVQHDHGEFDYEKLAGHFLRAGRAFNQNLHVFYVTDESGPVPEDHPGLTIVRLPTDNTAPMHERVLAMTAYVRSKAFNRDTAFLDTDAFPNRSLKKVFSKPFDIGVTFRTTPGFMPLNEGVIFASCRNRDRVTDFFEAYSATYQALIEDPVIIEYYGDVRRWRGGQLSLNAIACPNVNLSKSELHFFRDISIKLFPCNTHNYWVVKELAQPTKALASKFVLHLKGDSKRLIDNVIGYHEQILQGAP